jgi:hypothetical protein
MRWLIISLFLPLTGISQTLFKPAFDAGEARDMIRLCNSFTYLDLYGSDAAIIPEGYKKIYTSPVLGMDNLFQIYTKGQTAVICFRGSTEKKASWMENLYAAMIPVQGSIDVQGKNFDYAFGRDTAANVHSGYALSMAYLHGEILQQIKQLNTKGIYHIYITGHSQGGALAIMTRAYLEFGKTDLSKKNEYKVYTFAQPMSGNAAFAKEYNRNFCAKNRSFSMINPEDLVPTMPMSYNDTTFVRDNLVALFSKDQEFDKNKLLREGLMLLFESKLGPMAEKFGNSVAEQIQKEFGHVQLPEPTGQFNYAQVGNIIYLDPPEYPLELKDSAWLDDPEFLAKYPRDEKGVFLNKNVYKKPSMGLQHKPYNYYTAIQRKYFPKEYAKMEPKSFGL